MTAFVYILASKRNGTLYVGSTTSLARRIFEHKTEAVKGFTQKYHVKILVHVEIFPSLEEALQREKNLKDWQRNWKLELIEKDNPTWRDLYDDIV
jgi:putative endonuclease